MKMLKVFQNKFLKIMKIVVMLCVILKIRKIRIVAVCHRPMVDKEKKKKTVRRYHTNSFVVLAKLILVIFSELYKVYQTTRTRLVTRNQYILVGEKKISLPSTICRI